MESQHKHDGENENDHTLGNSAKESSPRVRRSSRRRVVTNRFINYQEPKDNDTSGRSDDEDSTATTTAATATVTTSTRMESSKSTSRQTLQRSINKAESTAAAGSSRKRKINHEEESDFSEGEEADDEGNDTPQKARASKPCKQKKKKKKLPLPTKKKKKTTTIKKTRSPSKDKVSIMEDTQCTTGDISDAEKKNSLKDKEGAIQKESPSPQNISTKKRGRPSKKSTAKTKKQRKKTSRGPEEHRTCPHCKRVFSIIEGLKYHIEHKVCFRKPPSTTTTTSPTKKRTCPYCQRKFSNVSGFNYHLKHGVCTKLHNNSPTTNVAMAAVHSKMVCYTLSPGQQFVTSYGVVQVVQDNREIPQEPSVEDQTRQKQQQKNRNNARSKIAEKIRKRLATVAVTTWTRREYLARLYKTTIPPLAEDKPDTGGGGGEGEGDETLPSSATSNNNNKMTSKNVLHAYFDKDPAQRPLPKKYRAIPNASKLGVDSNIFASYAPDRIVECILIPDERRKFYSLQEDGEEDNDMEEENTSWASTNDAKIPSSSTENTSNNDDKTAIRSTSPPQPHCSMRLFLKRRLLVTPYLPDLPVYVCRDCAQKFTSRDGFIYHRKCKVCVKKSEARGEQIRNNLSGIQERVERRIQRHDTVQKLKQEHGSDADDDADGDDSDDNNGNQHQEEISIDPMKGSAMYPEVYKALGYSSNKAATVTTTAVLPNHIAATTVAVLSGKVAPTKKTKKAKKTKDPKLPQNLGPPLENPNDALEKLKAEFEALENAVKDIPAPVKKVKKKVKKKKRKRKKTISVIEKAPLRIVDTMVLAEEVDSGRYPSIKRYDGEHADKCIVCKKGGTLLCCDFCSNVTHFSCIRTKLVVKEPEPEDDFMCHKCIQYILQRRVRAEKRRLRKTISALDKDPTPEESKEKIEENEYELVARRGLEVKQLIELLEDAENRLVELAGTAETNDIRRQLLI